MKILILLLSVLCWVGHATAATYYISPTGSNGNTGTSAASPWLTFAHAWSNTACGDTLRLLTGTYGDGTSTGKIDLNGRVCTLGNEFTIMADSQRQAKISDSGSGKAIWIRSSAYIVVDGLYARSVDNSAFTNSETGLPIQVRSSNHVTVRNSVFRNPNRYGNNGATGAYYSSQILFEDNEVYVFHRHCFGAWQSSEIVVRRQYCNPRGGAISGGYGASNGLNRADAVMSMYPCRDCILENSIADGTTSKMFLNEMNATYGDSIPMSGSKVLGSICYKCDYGNAIYPNSRNVADLNHTPQNIMIKDVAIIDFNSNGSGIRCSDCVNVNVEHVTVIGGGTGATGMLFDETATGVTGSQVSFTVKDSVVRGVTGTGYSIESGAGITNWSGNNLRSFSNGTAFSPALPSNWGTTYTNDPGFGACKGLWLPDGSVGKGQGTGGSDIGSTILYRYINGVLTTTPLWDPVTGEFPHGAVDLDGTNNVAGDSLFDIHTRLNVNVTCPFPAGYGSSSPTNPSNNVSSTDLTGAHIHVIDPLMGSLTVGVMVRWDNFLSSPTAEPTGVTSSCGGESIPALIASLATPAGDRKIRTFGKINPTSGTCTLTPTFSSGNVSGWVMISVEKDNVASYGPLAGTASQSPSPTVTVITNPSETVLDFLATSSVPTVSPGPGQIFMTDRVHATKSLRGSSSEQLGTLGGEMSYSLGGSSVGWVMQGVSLVPSGSTGTGSTFRVTNYRIDGMLGVTGDPEVTLGALGAQNQPGAVGTTGEFRIRAEILVETAASTSTSTLLYCRKNAGSYARITNTFGSNVVRFYGPGVEPNIPANAQLTTQRFSGTFQAGKTWRDDSTPMVLTSMPAGTRTEFDYQLVFGNGIVAGDVVECQIRRDDESTLGTHTVTPTITAVNPSASLGF